SQNGPLDRLSFRGAHLMFSCAFCLVWAKPEWHLSQKGPLNRLSYEQMCYSGRQPRYSKDEEEQMAQTAQVPRFVRVGNVLTMSLLRAGVKLAGPFVFFGNYPMYLLTVRGRTSGQPRTVALVIMQRNGKRYVSSPYGIVDWVRNLRAAREAILTRG